MRKQLSIALTTLVLAACGGGSSDNNVGNNITGKWDGSFAGFVNSATINGNVTMTLAQQSQVFKTDENVTGVYTSSSGSTGFVSGFFDGSSFTGDLTPSNPTTCSAKIVLLFSYNSLKGTAVAYNCTVSESEQVSFSKQ